MAEGIREPSDGFAEALRAAIAKRGVSLQFLHDRLTAMGNPVSVATLSYWRSGRSEPEQVSSKAALPLLEDLLRLPRGHLLSRLAPTRRLGRHAPPIRPGDAGGSDRADEVMEEMGFTDLSRSVESTCHAIMEVNADRIETAITYRQVWKALADGVDTVPSILTIQDAGQGTPTITALSGCRVNVEVNDSGGGVVASKLEFERPLKLGELAMTEYRISDLPPSNSDEYFYEHYALRRMNELIIGIRFHPDQVPKAVECFTEGETLESKVHRVEPAATINHVLRQFGLGKAGVRWFWD